MATWTCGSNQEKGLDEMISAWNRNLPVIATYLLAGLMMVCFAAAVVTLGVRLFPLWKGGYFLAVAFFVSLQVFVSRRYIEDTPMFSSDWFLQQAVEWMVIYVFLRLSIFLSQGAAAFQESLNAFPNAPLDALFPPEVIVALAFALIVRYLSSSLIDKLRLLEHDPDRLDMERKGFFIQNREVVRKSLISYVFLLGAGMLLMTAMVRVDVSGDQFRVVDAPGQLWNLVVYFIAGLALLGLTQFSTLRTRWYLQEIPMRRDLAVRWGIYSLVLLIGVAILASLLPTRYSIGFLTLLGWIIAGISFLLTLLQLLILAPFLFLIQWLFSLLGRPIAPPVAPPPPHITPPLDQTQQAAPPWLDLLKSILFWGTLLTVILFSLIYYLKQREDLVALLRAQSLVGWASKVGQWFLNLFHNVNARVDESVRQGIQRIFRSRRGKNPGLLPFKRSRSPADPREQILSAYLDLVLENQDGPLERKNAQTPREYQGTLQNSIPDAEEDIHLLTEAFIEARYTPHPISEKISRQARLSWKQISAAIQQFRENRKD